jgi:hypothetical protein
MALRFRHRALAHARIDYRVWREHGHQLSTSALVTAMARPHSIMRADARASGERLA